MKFVCPEHGEVKGNEIYDSCPAQTACPHCDRMLTDLEGGIRMMSEEEGVLARPHFYKKHHPEIYERYRNKIEKQVGDITTEGNKK